MRVEFWRKMPVWQGEGAGAGAGGDQGGGDAAAASPIKFVVLDDADLVEAETSYGDTSPGSSLSPYFVRVDKAVGLGDAHADAALDILSYDDKFDRKISN